MYNNVPYTFLKNLQGDVIGIADNTGNTVARYEYDAWGVCTATQNNSADIANVNPFRYRGYYYDSEIQMYYLQSRYYDAVVGRFVNEDEIELYCQKECAPNYSLFSYCNNNAVMYIDYNGHEPITISLVSLGLLFLACTIMVFFAMQALIALVMLLNELIIYLGKAIKSAIRAVSDAINKAIEKAKQRGKIQKTARHHIIARTSGRALPAKYIWVTEHKLSINDSRNLVDLNQYIHYYIHTIAYYTAINTLVIKANEKKDKSGG